MSQKEIEPDYADNVYSALGMILLPERNFTPEMLQQLLLTFTTAQTVALVELLENQFVTANAVYQRARADQKKWKRFLGEAQYVLGMVG